MLKIPWVKINLPSLSLVSHYWFYYWFSPNIANQNALQLFYFLLLYASMPTLILKFKIIRKMPNNYVVIFHSYMLELCKNLHVHVCVYS